MTISQLIAKLASQYGVSKRPLRYFDVPKRKELTPKQIDYATTRFEELVFRELCVEADPKNPLCYQQVESDISPKRKKRKSSYLVDYEHEFRDSSLDIGAFEDAHKIEFKALQKACKGAPKGLIRIAIETGLPLEALKEVYDIGRGAYASSGSRTGMTSEQWGYGRVYAFIMCYFSNNTKRYLKKRCLQSRTDEHIFNQIIS